MNDPKSMIGKIVYCKKNDAGYYSRFYLVLLFVPRPGCQTFDRFMVDAPAFLNNPFFFKIDFDRYFVVVE